MKQTLVLVVLDGWGLGRDDESNPIYVARPESFRYLKENFPVTSLQASGINVGLPWGEVGNSEVGHLTLGAGKILYQYYPRIVLSIRDGSFFKNTALLDAFSHARKTKGRVHFVGLLSRGNVHASLDHLLALIAMGEKEGATFYLHLMSDGKDSPPRTLQKFLSEVPYERISTLTGRYYAMDREGNWQLTQKAYLTLVGEEGEEVGSREDLEKFIRDNYARGNTEEFLPPLRIEKKGCIRDGDAVIFFNYREDSIRQLAEAFILKDFDKFPVKKFQNLWITTFSQYEKKLSTPVVYPPETVDEPLGRILSDRGKIQLRIAETYKYAHVTSFFNGYREEPFKNEYRVLIHSRALPHVDDHPEMMASSITDRLAQAIEGQSFDFILVNYANPDSIAHTGNYDAAIHAVKIIDKEIGRILKSAETTSARVLITADHGNIEEVINPMTALPETQHDPSPVPFYLVGGDFKGRRFINYKNLNEPVGILADVAPTILELMGIEKPAAMTGQSLLRYLVL